MWHPIFQHRFPINRELNASGVVQKDQLKAAVDGNKESEKHHMRRPRNSLGLTVQQSRVKSKSRQLIIVCGTVCWYTSRYSDLGYKGPPPLLRKRPK